MIWSPLLASEDFYKYVLPGDVFFGDDALGSPMNSKEHRLKENKKDCILNPEYHSSCLFRMNHSIRPYRKEDRPAEVDLFLMVSDKSDGIIVDPDIDVAWEF